ncbi:MAG: restriction endonuclease, partial [Clostridia bacterium]|nr:restriction endonuclease [Clostridia bacterium]
MFIKEIKKGEIKVAIPLTTPTGKARIKRRSKSNEYGIPVSTRSAPFCRNCYVEWQIGYDVVKSDKKKLENT